MRLIGSRKFEESEDIASFTDLKSHFSCKFCIIAKISQISIIDANLRNLALNRKPTFRKFGKTMFVKRKPTFRKFGKVF